MPTDDLKKTLAPVARDARPQSTKFYHDGNVDGSTIRQNRLYTDQGVDTTPTFSVAAEMDEQLVLTAYDFPAGAVGIVQHVLGPNSGDDFTNYMVEGLQVALTAENTQILLCNSGRYRVLFRGGWPDGAKVGELRQQRTGECGSRGRTALDWQPTGLLDCRGSDLFQQEVNQYGRFRWVDTGRDCGWQATGELQCRVDGLYQRERNEAGDFRWTRIAPDCQWVPTGERQCRTDHREWQLERNRAGDYRWTQTGDVCGYDPTYPLPCGGWAFGPGDVRDPAATVQLTDCVDNVGQGIWLYPTAGPGHTVPVYDCIADFYCLTPDDIEGYAANQTITGIRNMCHDGTSCGCNHNHAD